MLYNEQILQGICLILAMLSPRYYSIFQGIVFLGTVLPLCRLFKDGNESIVSLYHFKAHDETGKFLLPLALL